MMKLSSLSLLVTCRDKASVEDIFAIVNYIIRFKQYRITIICYWTAIDELIKALKADKAIRILKVYIISNKINYTNFVNSLDLNCFDALLAGISGPDFGIDEYITNEFKMRKKTTFAVQSFWGDVNQKLGETADTIFVIDSFAEKITKAKLPNTNVKVTGSPSLAFIPYKEQNQLRKEFRSEFGMHEDYSFTFYSQPLGGYRWYWEIIEDFLIAYKKYQKHNILFFRPHPKESKAQTDKFISLVKEFNLIGVDISQINLYKAMFGTKVAISLFSTIGYRIQQSISLSRLKIPITVPLYIFYNKEFIKWYTEFTGIHEIPLSQQGLAYLVNNRDQYSTVFAKSTNEQSRINLARKVIENIKLKNKNPLGEINNYLLER